MKNNRRIRQSEQNAMPPHTAQHIAQAIFSTTAPHAALRHHASPICHNGVRGGACAAPRVFRRKNRERTDKSPAGMLAFPAGFLDGFSGVHQSDSVSNAAGARCQEICNDSVRQTGSRGGAPPVRGAGAQSPRSIPVPIHANAFSATFRKNHGRFSRPCRSAFARPQARPGI